MNRRSFLRGLGILAAVAPVAKLLPSVAVPPSSLVTTSYYTYLMGKDAVIGQYADYVNFSDVALSTPIDPALAHVTKELSYRLAYTINYLASPPPKLPKIRAGAFVS